MHSDDPSSCIVDDIQLEQPLDGSNCLTKNKTPTIMTTSTTATAKTSTAASAAAATATPQGPQNLEPEKS